MLVVVVFRSEGTKYADGHISEANSTRVFCGKHIPTAVIEVGLDNPKNPYVGKSKATCHECISEFENGRRTGYSENG